LDQSPLSPPSVFTFLSYPVAPLSPLKPPRAGYGKDEIRITVKELEPLKESFRDLNQRLQKIGYKLIRSNLYGWYWRK